MATETKEKPKRIRGLFATPEEEERVMTFVKLSDEDLCNELRRRGYSGELQLLKTLKV